MAIDIDQNVHLHPPHDDIEIITTDNPERQRKCPQKPMAKYAVKIRTEIPIQEQQKPYSQNTENEQNIINRYHHKKIIQKTQKTKRKSKYTSNQCQFTHKSRFQSKFRHRNQNITQNLKSESKVTHRNTVLSKSIGDFSINRQTNAISKSSVPNHYNRPETQITTDIQRRMQCQT